MFFHVSLFFWLLLDFVGFLASVGCWLFGSVCFWRLLAFGFVGFVTVGYSAYRRMARDYIELVLASGKFCFFLLQLLFYCWWWWWWERPGLHAWEGGALPQSPSSFEIFDMKFYDTLWFCFCCFYLLFVISFLACSC